MKYEIEIPDGVIPDGYEPVAFRKPMNGEECVASQGPVFTSTGDLGEPRLILRRKWTWPEWLEADELRWGGNYWVAKVVEADNRVTVWALMWVAINHPEPPDRSRVYTNPRKGTA